jgi:hypothetical protein
MQYTALQEVCFISTLYILQYSSRKWSASKDRYKRKLKTRLNRKVENTPLDISPNMDAASDRRSE